MFKNHTVQMKVVKDQPAPAQPTQPPIWQRRSFIELVNKTTQEQLRNAAVVAGGLYAAKKILDTASDIVTYKMTH